MLHLTVLDDVEPTMLASFEQAFRLFKLPEEYKANFDVSSEGPALGS